jgi:hypothetical protein
MYLIVSVASLFWATAYCTEVREKRLRIPLAVNAATAVVLLLLFLYRPRLLDLVNPFGNLRVEFFAISLLVGIYVITLEVPGFLLNRHHDAKVCRCLDELQEALLKARASGRESISQVSELVRDRSQHLADAGILPISRDSAQLFTQLNNLDVSVCDLLLRETMNARTRVADRSKHAVPLLAELLGLSGLAFLLAEILVSLRAK